MILVVLTHFLHSHKFNQKKIKNFKKRLCKKQNTCYNNQAHADVAKLADALDLGSSGQPCRFDSCHPHHVNIKPLIKGFF